LEIRDKKGSENVVADHLSRLLHEEEEDELPLNENFPDEQLFAVEVQLPWYADIVNYLTSKVFPPGMSSQERKRLMSLSRHYYWDEPYLFKSCPDQIIRKMCLRGGSIEHTATLPSICMWRTLWGQANSS
jgi:hypothetical protein